ncbi:antigen 5 like allergen Cul n 1-like [Anopheles aquasalis]|uniref:antigen 5 like allergen Cul n 1-like n=1 Tax=Anopheles aquasalis TaxID=42839 RepID=UPI00215AA75C|nr:antigen 5 like allergen Cul n 1-like [Anopheles aquasalis]
MANRVLAIVVAISGFIGALHAQQYCNPSYCTGNRVNVGCNPPPLTGGPNCATKSPSVVDLNATYQNIILSQHNGLRSQLAIGNLTGFAPANRMPTLSWDNELAAQAGNNARSCNFAHDACRNTAVYAWAGQNIAITSFYGMTKTVETLITDMTKRWWDEYKITLQSFVDAYPRNYTGPAIGHFTQMASDRSSKIGCAMQYWLAGIWNNYYLVCNYGVTNVLDRAVYKKGATASLCTTGVNPNIPGLCSVNENVPALPNDP